MSLGKKIDTLRYWESLYRPNIFDTCIINSDILTELGNIWFINKKELV